MNIFKDKNYVITTIWSYPFGGGEEFMYQTMQWGSQLGFNCYWLCFTNAQNNIFEIFDIVEYPFGMILKIPGGFSEKKLRNWLKLLQPDFVHHQGHNRNMFYNQCQRLRIEFLTGFHFWHGAIILDSEKKNTDIIENAKYHQTDDEIKNLWGKPFCNYYTVTPFVAKCIKEVTGYEITDHIYASSDYKKIKIRNLDITKNKYVTMINIHALKGAELFLYLLEKCLDIPFLAVKTEFFSDTLDKKIEDLIDKRNSDPDCESCLLLNRVSNPKVFYQQSKIVIAPTLVDETFCRVVNEAMMNGIPVVSTGQGNVKYLMNNSGFIIPYEEKEKWVEILNKLYFDEEFLVEEGRKSLEAYKLFSENKAIKQFRDISSKMILKSKEMNIMIFSPWCDQGLGIQSKNYARILEKTDYNVYIFAVKPYNADTCLALQKNPSEWEIDNIYYSKNDREQTTDIEITNFVKKYNIGKCLLPETCWFRVFEIAKLLRNLNVKCYAIPNIEIVRKDELFKHHYFHKILCNNRLCENIFNKYGIQKTSYIGYGIDNEKMVFKKKNFDIFDKENNQYLIKFLFIGGMNAFSRKHILDICEAFDICYQKYTNILLTCTIQKVNMLEEDDKDKINKYLNHPGMNIIQEHLTHSEILDKYHEHHISIQVSKHEGLGIGFYESLGTGTPIITLDTPPHNEIVINEINGWIIPCTYKKMTDNKDPIFDSAYFNPKDLANKMIDIIENFNDSYDKIMIKLMEDYNSRLNIHKFTDTFLEAINI